MIDIRQVFDVVGKDKSFCPLFVSRKIGCSVRDVTDAIVLNEISGRFVNGLWDMSPKNLKWVYEICDTKYKRGEVLSPEFYWDYVLSNDKVDQHNSVYQHDYEWMKVAKVGSVSGASGSVFAQYLILELDRKNAENKTKKAFEDAQTILARNEIEENSMVFFSGNNSAHIYIDTSLFGLPCGDATRMCAKNKFYYNLAHLIAGDVRYSNGLVNSWNAHPSVVKQKGLEQFNKTYDLSKMRQDLENIDPNIYATNSLIRQPFSRHEKSNGLKDIIDVRASAEVGAPISKIFELPKPGPAKLLHLAVEAWHQVPEKHFHKASESEDVIISFYSQFIEFDPEDANKDGWVGGLYNPFYDDTTPSLAINIKDGRFYDFGSPDFQTSFKSIKYKYETGRIKLHS